MVKIHAVVSSAINDKFAKMAACACAYPLLIPPGFVNVGVERLDNPPCNKLVTVLNKPLIVYGWLTVPITDELVITGKLALI